MEPNDEIEHFPVTGDPEKLALVRRRWEAGADSFRLAEFAVTLGLTPPGHEAGGRPPSIVEVWASESSGGVLVWDLHQMEEQDIWEGHPDGRGYAS